MRRRRSVLAAALAVVALTGGCSDVDEEQEQLLDRAARGLFAELDLQDRVVASPFERRTSTTCAQRLGLQEGYDEEQAWYSRKDHRLREGEYDFGEQLDAARQHFLDRGYEVQVYEMTTPGSRQRGLTAIKDDVGVVVTGPPLAVLVSGGPCGPTLSTLGDRYRPVPPP